MNAAATPSLVLVEPKAMDDRNQVVIQPNAHPHCDKDVAVLLHKSDWIDEPSWVWNEAQVLLIPIHGSVSETADTFEKMRTLSVNALNGMLEAELPFPLEWRGKSIYFFGTTFVTQGWRCFVEGVHIDSEGKAKKFRAMFTDSLKVKDNCFIALFHS